MADGLRTARRTGDPAAQRRQAGRPQHRHRARPGTRSLVMVDGDTVFEPDDDRPPGPAARRPGASARSAATPRSATGAACSGRWQHLEYVIGFNLDRRMFERARVHADRARRDRRVPPRGAGGRRRASATDTLAEDTDLTMALCRAGWRVVYEETAIAWTEVPDLAAASCGGSATAGATAPAGHVEAPRAPSSAARPAVRPPRPAATWRSSRCCCRCSRPLVDVFALVRHGRRHPRAGGRGVGRLRRGPGLTGRVRAAAGRRAAAAAVGAAAAAVRLPAADVPRGHPVIGDRRAGRTAALAHGTPGGHVQRTHHSRPLALRLVPIARSAPCRQEAVRSGGWIALSTCMASRSICERSWRTAPACSRWAASPSCPAFAIKSATLVHSAAASAYSPWPCAKAVVVDQLGALAEKVTVEGAEQGAAGAGLLHEYGGLRQVTLWIVACAATTWTPGLRPSRCRGGPGSRWARRGRCRRRF